MTEPERLEGVPGRYCHRLEDGRMQCDVCPCYCRLNEGQRGLCLVRGRRDDRIVLTTCTPAVDAAVRLRIFSEAAVTVVWVSQPVRLLLLGVGVCALDLDQRNQSFTYC